jgi:hypothetical protein
MLIIKILLSLILGVMLIFCACGDDGNPASSSNHPPEILTVTASPTVIYHYYVYDCDDVYTTLSCIAIDSDADTLTYTWYCTYGQFPYGSVGISKIWSPCGLSNGNYNINVIVSDGQSVDSGSVIVSFQLRQ